MRKTTLILMTTVLALIAICFVGCGDDHHGSMAQSDHHSADNDGGKAPTGGDVAPGLVAVHPSNGAIDHPVNNSIGFRFSTPMNTQSVMANLRLVGGNDMHAWMDSLENHGDMGGMGGMMYMNFMRDWMDSICEPGEFEWCDEMDSCEFIPDSTMDHDCEYMIMMEPGSMMSHDGMTMDSTGCHGDFLMYHFTTELPDHLSREHK